MKVNGKTQSIDQDVGLSRFLKENGYDTRTIVVERNGDIIPRAAYPSVTLTDADTLEILFFVGGGAIASQPREPL